jgi:hypothetical protein
MISPARLDTKKQCSTEPQPWVQSGGQGRTDAARGCHVGAEAGDRDPAAGQ